MRPRRPGRQPRYLNKLWPIEEIPSTCTNLLCTSRPPQGFSATLTSSQGPQAGRTLAAEQLLPGTTMKVVLPPTITTSAKLVETTSTIAMAVMPVTKVVPIVAPVIDVVRVGYRHTSWSVGIANLSPDGHFANVCDQVRLDLTRALVACAKSFSHVGWGLASTA
jgi:hypothetical protein